MKIDVVIVGAGPSGLATAACLNVLSIPNIVLERDDCYASLWKKKTYDRLKLHLGKHFCSLPHMPHSTTSPNFIPKDDFIRYLDDYVAHFGIKPSYCTSVESATYDEEAKTWVVVARDTTTGEVETFEARSLVVATGENSEGRIPDVPGLESFEGEYIHSSQYKSGKCYEGKRVLVVGSGNSGMEIAYDLANFGAKTSITIRSPLHVMTKETIFLGMALMNYLPLDIVDDLLLVLTKATYGNLSKYGIVNPPKGLLAMKLETGRSAVIDVGTVEKIKNGEIQVVKDLSSIRGSEVMFSDGRYCQFDAIIFSTGYKGTTNAWLKDCNNSIDKDGYPKQSLQNNWKGENGLYFAGFSRRGIAGISMDAQRIANDIKICFSSNGAHGFLDASLCMILEVC